MGRRMIKGSKKEENDKREKFKRGEGEVKNERR